MYDPIYGEFEEHVKVGDEVWYCGDECDWPHIVKVGESRTAKRPLFTAPSEHCYEAVNTFWNRLYFDNEEDARYKNFNGYWPYLPTAFGCIHHLRKTLEEYKEVANKRS